MSQISEFISLDALAASLGLPRTYLRRLADEGRIPALDVNGRLRFDQSMVSEALAKLTRVQADQRRTEPDNAAASA